MSLSELESDLSIMLSSFRVTFNRTQVMKDVSFQLVVDEFGVIICGIERADYTLIKDSVDRSFGDGWRVVYVAMQDPLYEKKEEILWELMRSGYIRYIRNKYPRQFRELIVMQNFGKKIIEKRLEVWGGDPKYKYLVDENKAALNEAATYIMSMDPSFYDYMP